VARVWSAIGATGRRGGGGGQSPVQLSGGSPPAPGSYARASNHPRPSAGCLSATWACRRAWPPGLVGL